MPQIETDISTLHYIMLTFRYIDFVEFWTFNSYLQRKKQYNDVMLI